MHRQLVNQTEAAFQSEVAYAETRLPQRRLFHRRLAQALEALNPEALDPISSQIAAHYEQAGLFEQAILYYQRAGAVAAGVYAHEEAIKLCSRGLELLELALAESQQNDEHWWDSEIYRLRGELLQAQGTNPDDVEAVFKHALQIARTQQAKSLELRAAISLARLWQTTSRRPEAKQLLTPLYAWFSEDLDTPDLQTAQAFIAKL